VQLTPLKPVYLIPKSIKTMDSLDFYKIMIHKTPTKLILIFRSVTVF